jgi:hypothetical protein
LGKKIRRTLAVSLHELKEHAVIIF